MQSAPEIDLSGPGRDPRREKLRSSLERRELPALPLVVTKALGDVTAPMSLGALLNMAEYLAFRAGFGFYVPVEIPAPEIMCTFAFENENVLAQAIEEVRQAFVAESALLKAV